MVVGNRALHCHRGTGQKVLLHAPPHVYIRRWKTVNSNWLILPKVNTCSGDNEQRTR
jgi:hypothetical protein